MFKKIIDNSRIYLKTSDGEFETKVIRHGRLDDKINYVLKEIKMIGSHYKGTYPYIEYQLEIDLSQYRNCIDNLFKTNSSKYFDLKNKYSCNITNVSPSMWNNGFGRCEFITIKLYSAKSLAGIMMDDINGKRLQLIDYLDENNAALHDKIRQIYYGFIDEIRQYGKFVEFDRAYCDFIGIKY